MFKVDNFLSYEDLISVRDFALSKQYSTYNLQGWSYDNICPTERIDSVHDSLTHLLGYNPDVNLSFFRREIRDEQHHHRVHIDNSISEYSGILFLNHNDYCRGGTCFWKPNKPHIKGKVDRNILSSYYNSISTDTDKWNFIDFAEMRFGRFVYFDTSVFHSQYPLESWGEEFYGGRLTLNLFWNSPDEYIHLLNYNEVDEMIPLAKQFYNESNLPGKMVPEYFVERWKSLILSGNGFILSHKIKVDGKTVPTGFIGGVVSPALSDGVIECNEGFWYTDRKYRGHGVKLYEEFEHRATLTGAVRISMAHLNDDIGKVVGRFYERRGYEKIETHYYKTL